MKCFYDRLRSFRRWNVSSTGVTRPVLRKMMTLVGLVEDWAGVPAADGRDPGKGWRGPRTAARAWSRWRRHGTCWLTVHARGWWSWYFDLHLSDSISLEVRVQGRDMISYHPQSLIHWIYFTLQLIFRLNSISGIILKILATGMARAQALNKPVPHCQHVLGELWPRCVTDILPGPSVGL